LRLTTDMSCNSWVDKHLKGYDQGLVSCSFIRLEKYWEKQRKLQDKAYSGEDSVTILAYSTERYHLTNLLAGTDEDEW
jgi:hypothetical protein